MLGVSHFRGLDKGLRALNLLEDEQPLYILPVGKR